MGRFMRYRCSRRFLTAAAALAVASFGGGLTRTGWADTSWQNPAGGTWSDGGNWSGGVPNSSTAADFNLGSSTGYTVNVTSTASTATLNVLTDNVNLDIAEGQTLSTIDFYVGVSFHNAGQVSLAGSGTVNADGGEYIGYNNAGTFSQISATNVVGSELIIGVFTGAPGTYELSGGTLLSAAGTDEVVGQNSPGTFSQIGGVNEGAGFVVVNWGSYTLGGGQFVSSYMYVDSLDYGKEPGYVGEYASFSMSGGSLSSGTAYVNGGTFSVGGGSASLGGLLVLGNEGYGGTFSQSAGTFAAAGALQYAGATAAFTNLNIGTAAITAGANFGSYTLSGGTLTVAGATVNTGAAFVVGDGTDSATLNLSGGSSGASYSFAQGLTISAAATLAGGGTITNDAGNTPVIVSGTIAPTAAQNSITIDGSLTLQPSATTLVQRVGSTPSFGKITTTGNLALAGVLSVYEDAPNEGSTTFGQQFVILQTTGGVLSGVFSNIASGQRLYSADGSSFIVTINEGVDGDVVLSDFVPEPSEPPVLLLVAFGALALQRRPRDAYEASHPR